MLAKENCMRLHDDLGNTIRAYWDERAPSYSRGVRGELGDGRHHVWREALSRVTSSVRADALAAGRVPRALDVGCGPGFFSILLAELGCEVDALDGSDEMLRRARANVETIVPGAPVSFFCGDFSLLAYDDATFDIVVSRNVTWLMRSPEPTYAEWLRVLRPGGKLVVFDANWYRYLVDEQVDARRREDQTCGEVEEWDERSRATTAEERRCEELAANLPLTPVMRPAWDLEVLTRLGASSASSDELVWQTLWTASEQRFYASSPLFMVTAEKGA